MIISRLVTGLVLLALIGFAAFWLLTRPGQLEAANYSDIEPDLARGEVVFHAAGCASCHADPEIEDGGEVVLAGGERFPSQFGTFLAPNITPHPEAGIGGWSDAEIIHAIQEGVSPQGQHYYPAFPYTTYVRATPADIVSLVAYLRTLPESDKASQPHEIGFPFNIRRLLGLWKIMYVRDGWIAEVPETARPGQYLVEALGHCGECHTPRNMLGGLKKSEWLTGAPNPVGKGNIPDITPGGLEWSEADIAAFLKTGFTPDFDTAGGTMADVVRNMSRLSDADRAAIADYLKALPAD